MGRVKRPKGGADLDLIGPLLAIRRYAEDSPLLQQAICLGPLVLSHCVDQTLGVPSRFQRLAITRRQRALPDANAAKTALKWLSLIDI